MIMGLERIKVINMGNKIKLIFFLLIVIVFVGYISNEYFFKDWNAENTLNKQIMVQNKEKLAQLKSENIILNEKKSNFDEIQKELATIEKKIPNKIDIPKIIMNLNSLIYQNELLSEGFNVSNIEKSNDYSSISVSFQVYGKKENIEELLFDIEEIENKTTVEKINIKENKGLFNANMEINVYADVDAKIEKNGIAKYDFLDKFNGSQKKWYDIIISERK